MIIGDKDRFAIEFELDLVTLADPALAPWQYGRVRWWGGGTQIGRYEDGTTLRDVAIEAGRYLLDAGGRHASELIAAPADHVMGTIVYALGDDHGQSDERVAADEAYYRRFAVSPWVDVFDPWRIVLIEDDEIGRLIWCYAGTAPRARSRGS